jgi:RNA polymerase sigma factor (sigma-70 family)
MNPGTTQAQVLFQQCRETILRLGFRITRNAADAEEVLQETFLRLQQNLPRLDLEDNMAGWLFRTATRIALRLRQRRPLAMERPEGVAVPPDAAWGDPILVRRAIDKLPAALRDLVLHRFVSGQTPGEIARRRGVPPGRVRVQLFRALELLRKNLGDLR